MPGRNARYPVVYFNSIHPSEEVDLTASPELLATARRTVREVNALNAWSPTNGLCLAWPPAARVVAPTGAARLLDEFERAVNLTMMPNFVPFLWNRPGSGSGCTTEQAGATAAINDLLVSTHGHGDNASIWVLPGGWPQGADVSFRRLRVRGAFLISAQAIGTAGLPRLLSLTVKSLAGNSVALRWPDRRAPTVRRNGSAVAVSAQPGGGGALTLSWPTAAGASYEVGA